MLFTNMSLAIIAPCETFRQVLTVRIGAEVLVAPAIATMSQHMAIEVLTSVRAFEGAACHAAFEGLVVRFNIFARSFVQFFV